MWFRVPVPAVGPEELKRQVARQNAGFDTSQWDVDPRTAGSETNLEFWVDDVSFRQLEELSFRPYCRFVKLYGGNAGKRREEQVGEEDEQGDGGADNQPAL